jgi:hypothetical protein
MGEQGEGQEIERSKGSGREGGGGRRRRSFFFFGLIASLERRVRSDLIFFLSLFAALTSSRSPRFRFESLKLALLSLARQGGSSSSSASVPLRQAFLVVQSEDANGRSSSSGGAASSAADLCSPRPLAAARSVPLPPSRLPPPPALLQTSSSRPGHRGLVSRGLRQRRTGKEKERSLGGRKEKSFLLSLSLWSALKKEQKKIPKKNSSPFLLSSTPHSTAPRSSSSRSPSSPEPLWQPPRSTLTSRACW